VQNPPPKKKRILVVDDDQSITSLTKRALERLDLYEVREENLAEHAVAAARDFLPDLILLDWNMPVMSGALVAAHLADDARLSDVPIVFITGFAERARKLGYPCLEKPFEQNALFARVQIALAGSRLSS
jgi:CheY-like chemotaxis protein